MNFLMSADKLLDLPIDLINHLKSSYAEPKYFVEDEFKCKCGRPDCDAVPINMDLVWMLELTRIIYGKSMYVESGSRCLSYNRDIGSKDDSAHVTGHAADIRCTDSRDKWRLFFILDFVGFERIGVYTWGFHVDISEDKSQNVLWRGNS